jgi:hypothetical protein
VAFRLVFPALLALALTVPSGVRAQTVESTLALSLTATFTEPTATGARILSIRVGTKDLIEAVKQDLGLTGRNARLVVRRDIADLDFENSHTFLLLDGVLHPADDGAPQDIDLGLPDAFYGRAESFSRRRTDGVVNAFTEQTMNAIGFGDLAIDGFEMVLVGLETRSARLLTARGGGDVGFLFRSDSIKVMGGMSLDLGGFVDTGILSGTETLSSERLVP